MNVPISARARHLRLKPIVAAMLLHAPVACALELAAGDGEVEFDAGMLTTVGKDVDLARFAFGNPVDPGTREVTLIVNQAWMGRRSVRFERFSDDARRNAEACFDAPLLEAIGVAPAHVALAAASGGACRPLSAWLPTATALYDASENVLDITIAQADLARRPRGATDPASWDRGIDAARLNYAFNTYRSEDAAGEAYERSYLHIDAGLNLAGWRWRHRSSQRWSDGARRGDVIASYVERDLPSHGAQLTVGDLYTDGFVFDSIGLRGVRFASDDRMSADSRRGYAPTIRGTARGNALVTVKQNGRVIHEVTVPAGAFVIEDLYPTGYGGALEVYVTEADGTVDSFVVPYASLVQLLRPGVARFAVAAGEWRGEDGEPFAPAIMQVNYQRGLSNLASAYAGSQLGADYASVLVGTALNTPAGAFAADITNSWRSAPDAPRDTGQSVRLSYSHFLPATATSLLVAAHRYSNAGFWSLADHIADRNRGFRHDTATGRSRNRFDLQVDQPLGPGRIVASAALQDFWGLKPREQHAQLGYAMNFGSWSLSGSTRYRQASGANDVLTQFGISVPLGRAGSNAPRLSASAGHGTTTGRQAQATVGGALGARRQWSYGLGSSWTERQPARTNANVGHSGAFGRAAASYGTGGGQRQASFSFEGGALVHGGGVTLGQTLGDTIALVRVPHAHGARLSSSTDVRVDRRGYALVPSLAPYRRNVVEVDPHGVATDVQFSETTAQVVPRAGAIVSLGFDTRRERGWFLRAQREDGTNVPAGAEVFDHAGESLGMFGQDGIAFLTGETITGALHVRWGDASHQQCRVDDGRPLEWHPIDLPQIDVRCVPHAGES
jgi:outer membrane usher protein